MITGSAATVSARLPPASCSRTTLRLQSTGESLVQLAGPSVTRAIVRSIVGMCRELDTLLIAEGIETEAEAAALVELGVRYHQGFWYARPALEMLPAVRVH